MTNRIEIEEYVNDAQVSNIRKTADGYLAADVRVARTGVQVYDSGMFGQKPGTPVRVYRPEDEVFSTDAIKSYAHRPVTIEHPKDGVNSQNWRSLAVGHTGDQVVRDGDFVRVSMLLMDSAAIDMVERGHKKELSMGYKSTFVFEPGMTPDGEEYDAYQEGMRMNHLAVTAKARGGSQLKIGDSEGGIGMPDPIKTRIVTVDGLPIEATEQSAIALEKLTKDRDTLQKQVNDAAETHRTEIETRDTTIGELRAEVKNLKDAAENLDVEQMVQERTEVVEVARALDSTYDPKGKSNDQIRKDVVTKKYGADYVGDAAEGEIKGMFRVLARDAKADPVRNALQTPTGFAPRRDLNASDSAYQESVKRLSSAWQDEAPRKEG